MQPADLRACERHFQQFLDRYRSLFGRRSWGEFGRLYVAGLLSSIKRKSIEPIALEAGISERTLRYFIGEGSWDDEALLREHQRHVTQTLGDARGVLVLDTTGFPKKGPHSVGVKRQWCGQLGKEDNCQVAVTLTYASRHGHTLLNRRLYLPEEWARDAARRTKAGVPEEVVFRRSWELGLEMVEGARALDVPHEWVTGDEEFGQSVELHDLLESRGEKYIFEIRSNAYVWDRLPKLRRKASKGRPATGPLLRKDSPGSRPVREIAAGLRTKDWETFEIRPGSKGPLQVRVAWMPVIAVRDRRPGPPQWLLITQTLGSKPQTKYFLSNAPPDESLESMLAGAYSRFTIEQCHEQGKQEVGFRDYETRSWTGWHHHTALALVAHHFLVAEKRRLGEKISRDHPGAGAAGVLCRSRRAAPKLRALPGNAPASAEAQPRIASSSLAKESPAKSTSIHRPGTSIESTVAE